MKTEVTKSFNKNALFFLPGVTGLLSLDPLPNKSIVLECWADPRGVDPKGVDPKALAARIPADVGGVELNMEESAAVNNLLGVVGNTFLDCGSSCDAGDGELAKNMRSSAALLEEPAFFLPPEPSVLLGVLFGYSIL